MNIRKVMFYNHKDYWLSEIHVLFRQYTNCNYAFKQLKSLKNMYKYRCFLKQKRSNTNCYLSIPPIF